MKDLQPLGEILPQVVAQIFAKNPEKAKKYLVNHDKYEILTPSTIKTTHAEFPGYEVAEP